MNTIAELNRRKLILSALSVTTASLGASATSFGATPSKSVREAARIEISHVERLRINLGISREQFAARYQIPISMLCDWEQHRTEPDAVARTYLKLIVADPEGAAETLVRFNQSTGTRGV